MIATTCTPTKIVASPPRNRWRSGVHTGGALTGRTRVDRNRPQHDARGEQGPADDPAGTGGVPPELVGHDSTAAPTPAIAPSARTAQLRRREQPVGHHDERGGTAGVRRARCPRSRRGTPPSRGPRPANLRPRRRSRRAPGCGRSCRCRDRRGGAAPHRRRAPIAAAAASSSRPRRRAGAAGPRVRCDPRGRRSRSATLRRRARRRAPGGRRRRSPTRPPRRARSAPRDEVGGEALADATRVEADARPGCAPSRPRRRSRCGARRSAASSRDARGRGGRRSKLST